MVIVIETQFFEDKEHRYADYPTRNCELWGLRPPKEHHRYYPIYYLFTLLSKYKQPAKIN